MTASNSWEWQNEACFTGFRQEISPLSPYYWNFDPCIRGDSAIFHSFEEIVAAENLLYCFGILMEFVAFVKLRIKYPSAYRPYKVHVGIVGAVLMCIPPTL